MTVPARIALILAAALISPAAPAAAQVRPPNNVAITITWRGAPPDEVAFWDRERGRIPFERVAPPDRYVGHRSQQGGWVSHYITLSYGSEQFPLVLRTRYGRQELGLQIESPSNIPCTQRRVDRLVAVRETNAPAMRLSAMVQSRHLLRRQSDPCVRFGRRRLAEVYFRMSCSLAKDTDYLFVSDEAKTYFRDTAVHRAAAEREIADCDRAVRAIALASIANARIAARQAANFREASALSTDLLQLSSDEDWRSGFATLQIDEASLRAIQVADLADWRDLASSLGNAQQALEANLQLTVFSQDPVYRTALAARSLDAAQLAAYNPIQGMTYRAERQGIVNPSDWRAYRLYDFNSAGNAGYYADDYYRDVRYYGERHLAGGDRVYRGRDGRYYCRRGDGTTGLVIGAGVGALARNSIDNGSSSALATIISAERGDIRCR